MKCLFNLDCPFSYFWTSQFYASWTESISFLSAHLDTFAPPIILDHCFLFESFRFHTNDRPLWSVSVQLSSKDRPLCLNVMSPFILQKLCHHFFYKNGCHRFIYKNWLSLFCFTIVTVIFTKNYFCKKNGDICNKNGDICKNNGDIC